ncbi:MAG: hypothetical protein WBC91_25215 [Phototrophicaceae bacterium]
MSRNQTIILITVLIIVIVLGGLLAVTQFSDDTSAIATTESPIATEVVVATEASETEQVDVVPQTEEVILGSEGGYSIAFAQAEIYSQNDALLDNATLSSVERYSLITASFLTEIVSITINPDDITLIDDSGNEYPAIEDGTPLNPYAINSELTIGESLRGFVVFTLPVDAIPTTLQWCPAGNCDALIETNVTVNE